MKLRLRHMVYILLLILSTSLTIDFLRISDYELIPSLPANKIQSEVNDIYFELDNGVTEIDWGRLNSTLIYIDAQYDVADFRLATLIRILYDHYEKIPNHTKERIKKTLLRFRYWMDEPGENGMCYWSENHQILFASAEFLIGQLYPTEIFSNSDLTGKQHMEKAQKRILDWLELRWKYGFTEFYSNVYYNEDIAGMINLIDYAGENEIVKKTKMIMDLLIYDIASQKSNNMFVSVSGRAYEKGRKGGPSLSSNKITNFLWDKTKRTAPHINYGFIASKNYKVPPVLIEIGKDTSDIIIKQCNGINISQLEDEGFSGTNDKSIMMQWGMEAFSNRAIIRNTLAYVRENNLFSNEFLHDIKYLDFSLLRLLYLEPVLSYIFDPQTNGAAIQKSNTYTYKTKNYSLYSVQNYFPGNYGDQVHVSGMNIGNLFSVFHTHPALPDTVKFHSPNYWVGYGRLPHVAQEKNVSLSIYNIPSRKRLMEMDLLDFTHAYFPTELFDSVFITKNYAFGKKDSAYCAFIGRNDLILKKDCTDNLIQNGKKVFWIIEAGSTKQDGSFENFYKRILTNKINFNDNTLILEYSSRKEFFSLKFAEKFRINGEEIITEYDRYDSPYIKAKKKPELMKFTYKDKYLNLDFNKMIRDFN